MGKKSEIGGDMDTLFDGNRAFDHSKKLTLELGHRLAGSDKEKEAAAYIKSEFEKYGLVSSFQSFQVMTYQPKMSRLEVLEPKLGKIPCELVGLSSSTPAGGTLGELSFVETGDEEYLSGDLKGKILLLLGPVRYKKYVNLMRVRPKGMVVIEPQIGKPPSRGDVLPEWREKFGSAPMVRISLEDGVKLLKKDAKVVRMQVLFSEKKTRSANVIGELKGNRIPEEVVLIGGHYDSSPGVQGASDNAGGTALMLELARVFTTHGSARTIRFLAWGAEELGLRGSLYYSRRLKESDELEKKKKLFKEKGKRSELDNHRLCINLDVHGVILGTNQAFVLGSKNLVSSVRLLSKEIGPAIEVTEEVHSSDSTALSRIGIPSLSLARKEGTAAYLHTPLDQIEYLDANHLEMYGTFIEVWVNRYVANALSFPFERKIPDEQKKKIEDYFRKRLGIEL